MASLKECGIDLFGSNLPGIEEIGKLSAIIRSSERNMLAFADSVEENAGNNLAAGIGLCILGKYSEALEKLSKADDCIEKFIYMAQAQRNLGEFDESLASYDSAAKNGADNLLVCLGKSETLRCADRLDEADKIIKSCSNFEKVSADYHFCLGRLCDSRGEYAEAIKNYTTAIELDPEHQQALFQLAYSCDLRGDDEAAIDYYTQIKKNQPVYVNAMLNLAVLYEDAGEFEKALKFVEMVLQSHPNHKKAQLFHKDIRSSTSMIYDEEKEKLKTRHSQILEIPISDFELSVRSRNCLKKMNINTINDLLNISEAELLSYKNFGETSLTEIKQILDSKGLNLGMAMEDGGSVTPDVEINEENQELLNMPCQEMELSVRARRCLQRLGCKTVAELISKTEAELLGCKNFGVTSLNEIKDRLKSYGLSLRTID